MEEEIRRLIKKELNESLMARLDSGLIFTYIQNLEEENRELKKQLFEKAHHNNKDNTNNPYLITC